MADTSSRLDLPYIKPSQAQKHVTHNAALERLDALTQLAVTSFDAQSPPASPAEGQVFALADAPEGAWAGQGGTLAVFSRGGWVFIPPGPGWRAWDLADGVLRVYSAGTWSAVEPGLQDITGLGIGTSSDAVNRLAIFSQASLLSHDGAGHRLKVNKNTASDTASLVFQSGYSGHAEMGLAGTNDWSVKVSPDGTSWTEALVIDKTTGLAAGEAVQQSATDTTAGRLMRADFGYGPGNLVGSVAQSGGTPTGAVIEEGENANGHYLRLASGLQICHAVKTAAYSGSGAKIECNWTYPAAFAAAPVATFSPTDFGDATPSAGEMGADAVHAVSATSVSFHQYRQKHTANFASGDSLTFQMLAVGPWFT